MKLRPEEGREVAQAALEAHLAAVKHEAGWAVLLRGETTAQEHVAGRTEASASGLLEGGVGGGSGEEAHEKGLRWCSNAGWRAGRLGAAAWRTVARIGAGIAFASGCDSGTGPYMGAG